MKEFLLSLRKKRQYLLLFGDGLIIILAILVSYVIRVYFNKPELRIDIVIERLDPLQIIIVCVHLFSFYLMDLYNLDQTDRFVRITIEIVISILIAGLISSGIFFFFPKYVFGRQVLLINMAVLTILMAIWRKTIISYFKKNSQPKKLALIGNGQIVSSFIEELSRMPYKEMKATSVCVANHKQNIPCAFPGQINNYSGISEMIESREFDILAYDTTFGAFTDEDIRRILQI